MHNELIPFNRPYLSGDEFYNINLAIKKGQLSGDGFFTKKCHEWLENIDKNNIKKALLTHSCTASLEMSAILCDINLGDEFILPSFTFVSTANAFVLRGGKPVFVDIREDTLNIDESLIEKSITKRTKAIVVVHYAGVPCEMDIIIDIAKRHGLIVVEDAAQGLLSKYKNQPLGTIGDIGCFSFHETKNITCGEGGAILINNEKFIKKAEIIREKGTNRTNFIKGEVDKYSWIDIGSSYLPGELNAAFLFAQMEKAEYITNQRLLLWNNYNKMLNPKKQFSTPFIPLHCKHNGHMFYLINKSSRSRNTIISNLKANNIHCVFHYLPLHSSPFIKNNFTTDNKFLPVTDFISNNIIRIPFWIGLEDASQKYIVSQILSEFY